MAKKKPGPPLHSTIAVRGVPVPTPAENRAVADRMRRRIFLNLFRHNSALINAAKFESGWRFTVTICWREGEAVPCPAAVGHLDAGRAGHQVEVAFHVSVADLSVSLHIRVDDGGLVSDFARIGPNYVRELREVLERDFGLAYPRVEDEPQG